jgi:hypothetical protein
MRLLVNITDKYLSKISRDDPDLQLDLNLEN